MDLRLRNRLRGAAVPCILAVSMAGKHARNEPPVRFRSAPLCADLQALPKQRRERLRSVR
jgi:hypothetical protein